MKEHTWKHNAPVQSPTPGFIYRVCGRCGAVQVSNSIQDEIAWGYRMIDHPWNNRMPNDCDEMIIWSVLDQ